MTPPEVLAKLPELKAMADKATPGRLAVCHTLGAPIEIVAMDSVAGDLEDEVLFVSAVDIDDADTPAFDDARFLVQARNNLSHLIATIEYFKDLAEQKDRQVSMIHTDTANKVATVIAERGEVIEALAERNARLEEAMRKIARMYENQNINHVDYRVASKIIIDAALGDLDD